MLGFCLRFILFCFFKAPDVRKRITCFIVSFLLLLFRIGFLFASVFWLAWLGLCFVLLWFSLTLFVKISHSAQSVFNTHYFSHEFENHEMIDSFEYYPKIACESVVTTIKKMHCKCNLYPFIAN